MHQPGRLWFTVQSVIALGLLVAPFVSHAAVHLVFLLPGCILLASSLVGLVVSYRALGKSHSPWTRPIAGGQLVTTGPYSLVRHPVYSCYVLLGLGLELSVGSLLGVGVVIAAFIYYDLRTREEEKWLSGAYADFDRYRQQVRGRLIPGLY